MPEQRHLPGIDSPVEPMRGLTLWRPWSDAIVRGPKRVENRPWAPPASILGKLIAIHAGQKYTASAWDLPGGYVPPSNAACPKGIVGVARIVGYLDLRKDGRRSRTTLQVFERLTAHVDRLDEDPWWAGPVGWLLEDVENRSGEAETARYSIPANHKRDDDLRLSAFVRWAGRQAREVERLQRLIDRHVAEAARARVPMAGAVASTMDALEDLRAAIGVLNGELFFPTTAAAQAESEEKDSRADHLSPSTQEWMSRRVDPPPPDPPPDPPVEGP